MTLEELVPGLALEGVESGAVVSVVAVERPSSEARTLIYRTSEGLLRECLLTRADEDALHIATTGLPWSFEGDGDDFKLAVEAQRISLAFLFDPMMAVHSSGIEPLPHQITAVYEAMLPRQPLRFVLADDPGAGKTIMAGLYIRELIMRADAQRILIVAPGSLVEQWRDELLEKFGLEFPIYTAALDESSATGNAFEDHQWLVARLDQLARNEESLWEKVCASRWDLVVFDEAHKLAAHFFGTEPKFTARFRLGKKLAEATRHLLLMTATPHNGKEEDFQLFLSLLDEDRFCGRFRDGVHKVDTSDLIRRMVKEELVKFDGTPLFPERRAHTVTYRLSPPEDELYRAVTAYVKNEMGKADRLDGSRKGSVGFALTSLQRRLASSPEAIYQSLKRRHERLEKRLGEAKKGPCAPPFAEILGKPPFDGDDEDDLTANEQEDREETLVEGASAAQSVGELEAEIRLLKELERQAKGVVVSGKDRKWEQLSEVLRGDSLMRDATGRQRKLIVFSEHRDTLNYLRQRIVGVLGKENAVITIHGATPRDERLRLQAQFRVDPDVRVLVATDAAGEGVNLQNAHLMVNYDLPWNPNRLEQRFGRIHRIGQQEVCHLWNLVAHETREGDVYLRLLQKMDAENEALGGRVFNILGDILEEVNLKKLLIEAIRYGDEPERRSRLFQKIEGAFDRDRLRDLLDRHALAQDTMSPERLFAVREEMEKAEARRLQPHFVRSFFLKAFSACGGVLHPRESRRYEITRVPEKLLHRDRRTAGRNRRDLAPVVSKYERVCFTRDGVRLDRPGFPPGVLLHPGHPLMRALLEDLLEEKGAVLQKGALLVDETDEGDVPSLLFLLTHEVKSGDGAVLSKRLDFVRVGADDVVRPGGGAPHLDLVPLSSEDRLRCQELLREPWLQTAPGPRARALEVASRVLAPEHHREVTARHQAHIDKTWHAVHERLTKEISYWTERWLQRKEGQEEGKDLRLAIENDRRTIEDLSSRLERRKKELQAMRHTVNCPPVVLGGALVLPGGLLRRLRGEGPSPEEEKNTFAADAEARRKVELKAMEAVRRHEEARGCRVVDVSGQNCGWDLTSYPPAAPGTPLSEPRHIEVKGRVKGATTVTVTRNEVLCALNQGEKFVLALVLVDEDQGIEGPYFVKEPFSGEPEWGVASINYDLQTLRGRAERNPT